MRQELKEKQKRVMISFIQAAKELIRAQGVENLTVRKVAAKAGYNVATLYNYFEDMEELIVYASMGYLRRYYAELEARLLPSMNALERYRKIYEVFSRHCFAEPEVFYNLFHGKHKKRVEKVIASYYRLFPEELGHHNREVEQMLTNGEMRKRDLAIMPTLVEQGFVKEENVAQTVNLLVRMFQSFLYDAWMQFEEKSIEERVDEVMEAFDYLMKKAG